MPMAQATLAAQLQNLAPAADEATAITNLVDAYGTYAADAEALTPILSAGIALGKNAMAAALSGMSASGAGTTKIPAAIVAFWTGVAGGLTSSFAGATLITPPPNATLAASLAATFPANAAGELSLADACDAIAADMHANAIVGGAVTTPPAVVTPIL